MSRLLILLLPILIVNCVSIKDVKKHEENLVGVYTLKSDKLYQNLSNTNYSSLEIHRDGVYVLNKTEESFSPLIEQCSYSSKGKWSVIARDIIEITSDDYYERQKGFEYEIKKENKFSQDSLYIRVVFPTDFHPVKSALTFNYNNSKTVTTNDNYIALAKEKYLLKTRLNQISFNLEGDISGVEVYKSRLLFRIFEENIDTEKFNFLTITLPNFDRCFFEFEPYIQELIYIKGEKQLLWLGEVWEK